jgi:DNA polymerase-3 subunit epsilon
MPFRLNGRAVVDVLRIFHEREPRDLAAALRFYCGQEHTQAHRAAGDVRATVAILDAHLGRYKDLPRTIDELHRRQVDVDVAGWFRREAGQIIFAVGKHQGRSLLEVAKYAPDYLHWMRSQALLPDARGLVEQALMKKGDSA